MNSVKSIITLFLLTALTLQLQAQSDLGYIYGSIQMRSGERFEGFMRWGKEEMYWHDVFNSTKSTSKSRTRTKGSDSWSDFDWNIFHIWSNKYRETGHTFACFYGDIQSLKLYSGDKVDVVLKNGETIKVQGGSNDIGTTIRLMDYEIGWMKMDWNKIKQIDFYPAEHSELPEYGRPLYGKVKTYRLGDFTGYVKWDMDERSGQDILDGESKYGRTEGSI